MKAAILAFVTSVTDSTLSDFIPVAERIASQVGRLGALGALTIAGGGALNPGLRAALEDRLGETGPARFFAQWEATRPRSWA